MYYIKKYFVVRNVGSCIEYVLKYPRVLDITSEAVKSVVLYLCGSTAMLVDREDTIEIVFKRAVKSI